MKKQHIKSQSGNSDIVQEKSLGLAKWDSANKDKTENPTIIYDEATKINWKKKSKGLYDKLSKKENPDKRCFGCNKIRSRNVPKRNSGFCSSCINFLRNSPTHSTRLKSVKILLEKARKQTAEEIFKELEEIRLLKSFPSPELENIKGKYLGGLK